MFLNPTDKLQYLEALATSTVHFVARIYNTTDLRSASTVELPGYVCVTSQVTSEIKLQTFGP
jgi:hypothetical protein